MDYAHATYFAGAQPAPYPSFVGIPPLTPSHSNSAGSDDFNHASPPDGFEHFANDQFPGFEGYAAHFSAEQGFPGPPTPPNQHPLAHPAAQQQQPPFAVSGAQPIEPPAADATAATMSEPPSDEQAQAPRQGSNSEEDDRTPAQSRRKAQNRAAQRAFRERKERHVKELEAKLASLEAAQRQTTSENERLRREMQKISTENEILRATSALQATVGRGGSPGEGGAPPPAAAAATMGPLRYEPTDFFDNVLSYHPDKRPSRRVVTGEGGERLYAAGATWEFIIGHELFKGGGLDLADVSERLKDRAQCDGHGPVFAESVIVEAMQQSAAFGSDELL